MRRRVLLSAALLTVAQLAYAGPAAASPLTGAPGSGDGMTAPATGAGRPGTVLPRPTGALPVGTVTEHLVDAARPDPWAPDHRPRELMIQTWYPARPAPHGHTAPYQSAAAAEALEAALGARPGSLQSVTTHARQVARPAPGRHPLLLFSPGRGGNRTNLTAVAEDLASHGFVVVGVDHTHDALAVQLPDRVARANRPTAPDQPTLAAEVAVRAADLRFVLDRVLAGRAARPVARRVDRRRIGVFGHSLGGATAAEVLRTDRRTRAGVNIDGGLPDTGAGLAVDRPFLLYTQAVEQESWTRWRAEQRCWGRHLTVTGAGHYGFTDLDVIAADAGLPPETYRALLGTIPPGRTTALSRSHVRAFFRLHLQNRHTTVFDRPAHPEVAVITGR